MNNNSIEERLKQASVVPDVPAELRADVADMVAKRLRRSTMIDDLRLLSLTAAILLAVLGTTWFAMNRTTNSLKQLTESNWKSENGEVVTSQYNSFHEIVDFSQLLNPNVANHLNE